MKLKKHFILVISLIFIKSVSAQVENDSISSFRLNELIMNQIELLSENDEETVDYSELIDSYLILSENPININSAEIDLLLDLRLINAFQYEHLLDYRKKFGDILFSDELKMIEGFDENSIALILPILLFSPYQTQKLQIKNLLKYGKNQVVARVEQTMEPSVGYSEIDAAELYDKPNSRYLGSRQKLFTRYSYNYRNQIRAGLTVEKDAGEPFFMSTIPDTLQPLLSNKRASGFDFYSFHLYISKIGIVKDLVVGDYRLSFGQGLSMSSGMSFGKTTMGNSVMKMEKNVRPSTGASEGNYLRGTAFTVALKSFSATFFYSYRKADASYSTIDNETGMATQISSILTTGQHRTFDEIRKRNIFTKQLIGGHIAYKINKFEIGYTLHHTKFSAELIPTATNYNQFYFTGNKLTNQGIDFRYLYKGTALFGEASISSNGGKALLAGVTMQPAGYINFSILYRNYAKDYQNFYSTAFAENSRVQNEEGIFLVLNSSLAPGWQLTTYADFFRFPWLKNTISSPSHGHDYYLQITHQINRRSEIYFRLRSREKMINYSDDFSFHSTPITYTKNSARIHFSNNIDDNLILKSRAEYIHYNDDSGISHNGYIMYQDINYRPSNLKFDFSFRYAIFNADDYSCSLYTYENDVLYAFSVPGFYKKGMRLYLLFNYDIMPKLKLSAKIGSTIYSDIDKIGSGNDLIEGNHRTDAKIQLNWKF